ncbi:hypothetical protein WJX72_000706 [[Myrmecia] bisecta]|uniref:Polymerase nucleotidyl transferase domain-containing protein n=1 Tax=[Myrmecia] bisecta TaxID=41462 RepID=A0AAW1PMW2_9CHLO
MASSASPEPKDAAATTSGTAVIDARVEALLKGIKPAQASEHRRHQVAQFVRSLIIRCFHRDHEVEAFMFGSVPLKTYLPDGDIDLSVFQSKGSSLRDTWANRLAAVLEDEQHNQHAPLRVRDVQVIHAEVKLLKCLVDNIVVDISFETLGGLCTVTFLESIDRRIGRGHLFKRSIILVKAWCYYESRLLGAHHGLISTYALETMVLYIFNMYHEELASPLQVLHKFLVVLSKFDWECYCLSLQGPIPLATFPNPKVEPVDIGDHQPLLHDDYMRHLLDKFSPQYPVGPGGLRTFAVKHLNIMDPLLPSNNLGRSVSRASFARIRKALGHGAVTLAEVLQKDGEEARLGIDHFFRNTWNVQRTQPPPPPEQRPRQQPHPQQHPQQAVGIISGDGHPTTTVRTWVGRICGDGNTAAAVSASVGPIS